MTLSAWLRDRLRHYRGRSKLSNAELADKIGISESTMRLWLRTAGPPINPQIGNIDAFCREVGVPLGEFFLPLHTASSRKLEDIHAEMVLANALSGSEKQRAMALRVLDLLAAIPE